MEMRNYINSPGKSISQVIHHFSSLFLFLTTSFDALYGKETAAVRRESFREERYIKVNAVGEERESASEQGRKECKRAERMGNFSLWAHTGNQYLISLSAMIRRE